METIKTDNGAYFETCGLIPCVTRTAGESSNPACSPVEKYLQGVAGFVAQSDDNPDCIPFYRAWRGVQNVLGKETLDRWHHLFHEAIGLSLYQRVPDREQFAAILKHAGYMCERGGRVEEPRYSYSWESAPSEPTEHDARQFFNVEYKLAFPGKRANSKHANQLWQKNRDKALSILTEQYQARLADHKARQEKRELENARLRAEWIGQAQGMAQFEDLIRTLQA
jgi:hypothetical protein